MLTGEMQLKRVICPTEISKEILNKLEFSTFQCQHLITRLLRQDLSCCLSISFHPDTQCAAPQLQQEEGTLLSATVALWLSHAPTTNI